jgi:trk system potassium uptake protein TrkA
MFVVVLGGGKVGGNVARSLVENGHEVVLVEQQHARAAALERDLGHRVVRGDATELYVLERAGLRRPPDIAVAVTGDDEDNIVICQLAREKYGVGKVIARVNDPRNQPHFDLLGIAPTISATETILALIEHEVPEHGLVHLLQLRRENLEIVEVEIARDSPAAGRRVEDLRLPPNTRLISVIHGDRAEIVVGSTELAAGDQVLAILERGAESDLLAALAGREPARRSRFGLHS